MTAVSKDRWCIVQFHSNMDYARHVPKATFILNNNSPIEELEFVAEIRDGLLYITATDSAKRWLTEVFSNIEEVERSVLEILENRKGLFDAACDGPEPSASDNEWEYWSLYIVPEAELVRVTEGITILHLGEDLPQNPQTPEVEEITEVVYILEYLPSPRGERLWLQYLGGGWGPTHGLTRSLKEAMRFSSREDALKHGQQCGWSRRKDALHPIPIQVSTHIKLLDQEE